MKTYVLYLTSLAGVEIRGAQSHEKGGATPSFLCNLCIQPAPKVKHDEIPGRNGQQEDHKELLITYGGTHSIWKINIDPGNHQFFCGNLASNPSDCQGLREFTEG